MLTKKPKPLKFLLLLFAFLGLSVSTYHLGVEQHWWKGPEHCTVGSIPRLDGLTQAEKIIKLRAQLDKKKNFVPCDQVNWRIFGISAVLWSALMYLALCILSWIIYGQKNTQKYFAR